MSEALYIPEENLEEVIRIIRAGMKNTTVSRSVKRNLDIWIKETEEYLQDLQDDSDEEEVKPKKRK